MLARLGLSITLGTTILFAAATESHAVLSLPLRYNTLERGQFRLGLGSRYLKTDSNYDSSGDRRALDNGASLQSVNGVLFGQYGAAEDFTVYTGFEITANEVKAKTGNAPAAQTITTSGSGLGDGEIGIRFLANKTPLRLFFDFGMVFPLYTRLSPEGWSTFNAGSDVPLGNGITAFRAGGTVELPLATHLYAGLGVDYVARSEGFSNLILYRGYLSYEEKRGFFGRLGLFGQGTASEDRFSGQTGIPERATNAIAGSQAYNAINPTSLKVDVALGSHISDTVFLHGGLVYPLTGKNIPREPTFGIVLGFEFGGATPQSDYSHSNRGFNQYYFPSQVIQANNDLSLLLINKGRNDGVKVGELMDVFKPDQPNGSFGETIGRAKVLEAGPTRSKLKILEYFKRERVEEGFVVRRPVR